jgi:hypothetical protein
MRLANLSGISCIRSGNAASSGYEIINGEQESPIKAGHVDLPVDAPTRDALKILFATNWTVRKDTRQIIGDPLKCARVCLPDGGLLNP